MQQGCHLVLEVEYLVPVGSRGRSGGQSPPIGETSAWATQIGVLAAADQRCPVLFTPRGAHWPVVLRPHGS